MKEKELTGRKFQMMQKILIQKKNLKIKLELNEKWGLSPKANNLMSYFRYVKMNSRVYN